MAPIVHGLEAKYYNKINFVYLDIDDNANSETIRQLGFRFQPEFYLIDENGNVIQKWVGPVTEVELEEAFQPHTN